MKIKDIEIQKGDELLVEAAGPERFVHLDVEGCPITVRCPADLRPTVGAVVPIACDPNNVHVFDPNGSRRGCAATVSVTREMHAS